MHKLDKCLESRRKGNVEGSQGLYNHSIFIPRHHLIAPICYLKPCLGTEPIQYLKVLQVVWLQHLWQCHIQILSSSGMVHDCNSSIQEAEARKSPKVQGHSELYNKLKASLNCCYAMLCYATLLFSIYNATFFQHSKKHHNKIKCKTDSVLRWWKRTVLRLFTRISLSNPNTNTVVHVSSNSSPYSDPRSLHHLRRGFWARLCTRAQAWLFRGCSSTGTFKGRRTGFWSSSSLRPAKGETMKV